MLRKVLQKRVKLIAPIFLLFALSLFLTATTAFAETQLIKAKTGGLINMARGIKFRIPSEALEEDTIISIDMELTTDSVNFTFKPSRLRFRKPAKLELSWKAIENLGLDGLTLYGEDGEELEPEVTACGVKWYIAHFSLYYHRRR
jgi:hypothetical protein